NGQPSNDIIVPMMQSVADAAVKGKANSGAVDALRAMRPRLLIEAQQVAAAGEKAKTLTTTLNGLPPPNQPAPNQIFRPVIPANIKRAPEAWGGHPLPPAPEPGSRCAKAKAEMQAKNFEGALTIYQDVRKDILK